MSPPALSKAPEPDHLRRFLDSRYGVKFIAERIATLLCLR